MAHAPLVTPDIPLTVAGLIATYAFWRYLKVGTWRLAVAAGVLLGVTQLTKFTALVLFGVWPVLAVVHALDRSNVAFRAVPPRTRLVQGGLIVFLSVWVMNLGYGFDGSFTPLGEYNFVSRSLMGGAQEFKESQPRAVSGNRFRGTWLGAVPVPLPRGYLEGIDVQRRDLEGTGVRPSYLAGEWRVGGWWYYYIYALVVKVPVGTLALALWGLVLSLRRSHRSASWADETTVWLPALAILALTSAHTGFNHHSRYILPMAPFVCVATGKLGRYLRRETRKAGFVVSSLLLLSILSSLSVYPHSLSYFNELAGGPDSGYKHLANSNIDWGQDLYYFRAWAETHPEARPLGLAYYNLINYRICGADSPASFLLDVCSASRCLVPP